MSARTMVSWLEGLSNFCLSSGSIAWEVHAASARPGVEVVTLVVGAVVVAEGEVPAGVVGATVVAATAAVSTTAAMMRAGRMATSVSGENDPVGPVGRMGGAGHGATPDRHRPNG